MKGRKLGLARGSTGRCKSRY